MYSCEAHYNELLAAVYTRVYGGREANVTQAASLLQQAELLPHAEELAVDCGAGSGFWTEALSNAGYRVMAFDLNQNLLDELASAVQGNVTTVRADMLELRQYLTQAPALIVCMTDTLAHLGSADELTRLCGECHAALKDGGAFMVSYRDQSQIKEGVERFLPFYSDDELVATTFLEYEAQIVRVTDLIYQKTDKGWQLHKSSYDKFRLRDEEVDRVLHAAGFTPAFSTVVRGMRYLCCVK